LKINFKNITMSDNKLVKTIMDSDWLSRWHRLGKQKGLERRLDSQPQHQRHELRQVHRCHGYQHRA